MLREAFFSHSTNENPHPDPLFYVKHFIVSWKPLKSSFRTSRSVFVSCSLALTNFQGFAKRFFVFTLSSKQSSDSQFEGFLQLWFNVLALGEEADFEAQNCLPALILIRSTKLHLALNRFFAKRLLAVVFYHLAPIQLFLI